MNKKDKKDLLSIVVPVFNEEKTLKKIYKAIKAVNFPLSIEIILVDDCSSDGSRKIIDEIAANDPCVRKVFKEKNEGKGSAVQEGIKCSKGDFIIIQDADLEYNPEDILKLLPKIMNDVADVVYGSRFSPMSSQVVRYYHYLGNCFLTTVSNLFTNIQLTDMETCYKLFRDDIIRNIRLESKRFGFEPEVTAKISKLNCRIHELPIRYHQRSYDEGKKIGIKRWF
jgi:glycosyltransferase involved in cell wall biosynthesis